MVSQGKYSNGRDNHFITFFFAIYRFSKLGLPKMCYDVLFLF